MRIHATFMFTWGGMYEKFLPDLRPDLGVAIICQPSKEKLAAPVTSTLLERDRELEYFCEGVNLAALHPPFSWRSFWSLARTASDS